MQQQKKTPIKLIVAVSADGFDKRKTGEKNGFSQKESLHSIKECQFLILFVRICLNKA